MIVVFDTNAYRKFVENKSLDEIQSKIKEIISKERSKGYIAYMSSTVAMEIMSHLKDDEDDRNYKSCIKSAQALYFHCGDEKSFRLIPLPETQLSYELFGLENKKSRKTQEIIGKILFQIAVTPTKEKINEYDSIIQQIIDFIHGAEKCLQDQVEIMATKIDPSYSDWTLFKNDESNRTKYLNWIRSNNFFLMTGLAFLTALYIDLSGQGIELPTFSLNEIQAQVGQYVKNYPEPLELRRYWMSQLPGHFDLSSKSRSNFIWDEKILHIVNKKINGEPILLVTSDNKMIECSKLVSSTSNIVSLDEYLNSL